ncbi:MAG: hypothetical protein WAW63_04350 [Candidatus Saccharimonadales bacterium]
MTDESRITMKSENPTAITSTAMGSNVNALAFNLDLIASKNPDLAIAIMELYEQAKSIDSNDPVSTDQDFALALKRLSELFN